MSYRNLVSSCGRSLYLSFAATFLRVLNFASYSAKIKQGDKMGFQRLISHFYWEIQEIKVTYTKRSSTSLRHGYKIPRLSF